VTETNHAGGFTGGITTGMPILFHLAFKPTPSISLPQKSISLSEMKNRELIIRGRHDPCIVPRAVPVVEAVSAIVVLDDLLSAEKGCLWKK
jgi:chorismate synthase